MATEKSVRIYNECLLRIQRAIKDQTDDWYLNSDKIVEWIEGQNYSLNTKKLYYIALVATLTRMNEERYTKCLEVFRAKMNSYNEEQQKEYEKQEMNEKERAKYCSWKEILEVRNKVWDLVEDYHTYQDYLILCLYTMIPPLRVDYGNMRVFTEKPTDYTGNYLLYGTKSKFVLQEYKTEGTYGVLEIPVSKSLQRVLKEWRDLFSWDSEYLLYTRWGKPMDDSCLGNWVRALFKKHTNKPTGVSMIRHAFVNEQRKGEKKMKNQEEIAKLMAHSLGMNVLYRRT